MKEDIRNYARLGLVHHMLWPNCQQNEAEHAATLLEFLRRKDIETFDCCLPYNPELRKKLAPAIRNCKKEVCFAIHFFPLRHLPLAATDPVTRAQTWMLIDDMIEQAKMIGASGFIFGAGRPAWNEAKPEHFAAFETFCRTLCAKLRPAKITAMLEPFDFSIDKKFLYGPIDQCVELAEKLAGDFDNFGFELDMAHLPLMGEPFDTAIARSAPFLKRVHLGNCVLKNRQDPRWGDTHPPMGYPGGEIDVPELTGILRNLLECGFLSSSRRGSLLIEMTPFPGKSVDETVNDNMNRLEEAWRRV